MSLYNYFSKLGSVNYNDSAVTNVVTSIRFKEIDSKHSLIYYPYTIQEGERPDVIAANYYGDERYSWLVYLSNNIVDPYYQWPLSVSEFNDFIVKKYGSIAAAQARTAFYRNNWYTDENVLSPVSYNGLPSDIKKYWSPIIGYNGNAVSYERKKEDTVVETNRTMSVELNSVTGLSEGDLVYQRTSGTLTGAATIGAVKDSAIIIKHITGDFSTTGGSIGTLTNESNTVSKSVTGTTNIYYGIPLAEVAYWEPVSFYEYENESNEAKKNINLVDRQYLDLIEDQMIELLR